MARTAQKDDQTLAVVSRVHDLFVDRKWLRLQFSAERVEEAAVQVGRPAERLAQSNEGPEFTIGHTRNPGLEEGSYLHC